MTVTSGFFNSVNHDRKYNAEEISSIFDGIILDGVYQGFGEALKVEGTSTANQVKIGTGRAWFNHTWTLNDEALYLTLPAPNSTYPRIDAIVLEVNNSSSVRANTIKYISGSAASSPAKPTLTNTTDVHQYPLAYITRPKATNTISAGNIENAIGTSACPIVTGVLEVLNDDRFIAQTIANLTTDFNTWFEGIKDTLDGNTAGNLLNKINENTKNIEYNYNYINNFVNAYNSTNNTLIPLTNYGEITKEKQDKIRTGELKLNVGDYFTLSDGTRLMVVAVNFYKNKQDLCKIDSELYTNNHVVVCPTKSFNDGYSTTYKGTFKETNNYEYTVYARDTSRYPLDNIEISNNIKTSNTPYIIYCAPSYNTSDYSFELGKILFNTSLYYYAPYDTTYNNVKSLINDAILREFPFPIVKDFGGKIEYKLLDMVTSDALTCNNSGKASSFSNNRYSSSSITEPYVRILEDHNSGLNLDIGNIDYNNPPSFYPYSYYKQHITNNYSQLSTNIKRLFTNTMENTRVDSIGYFYNNIFGVASGRPDSSYGILFYGIYSNSSITSLQNVSGNSTYFKYNNKVYYRDSQIDNSQIQIPITYLSPLGNYGSIYSVDSNNNILKGTAYITSGVSSVGVTKRAPYNVSHYIVGAQQTFSDSIQVLFVI